MFFCCVERFKLPNFVSQITTQLEEGQREEKLHCQLMCSPEPRSLNLDLGCGRFYWFLTWRSIPATFTQELWVKCPCFEAQPIQQRFTKPQNAFDFTQSKIEGQGNENLDAVSILEMCKGICWFRWPWNSGLDNAGKTTIVKQIMKEDVNTVSPTLGFIIKTIDYEGWALTYPLLCCANSS